MVSPLGPAGPIAPRDAQRPRALPSPPRRAAPGDEETSPETATARSHTGAKAAGASLFAAQLLGQGLQSRPRAQDAAGAYRLQDAADAPVRRFLNV